MILAALFRRREARCPQSRTARPHVEALEDRRCLSTVDIVVLGAPSGGAVRAEQHLSVAAAAAVTINIGLIVNNPTTNPPQDLGKAKFPEFTITKTTDPDSPAFFGNAESGSHKFQVPVPGGRGSSGDCRLCERAP
jgi:hypothetical protein